MGVGVAGLGRRRDFRPSRFKRTGACGDHGCDISFHPTDTPGLQNLLCCGPQVKARANARPTRQPIITRDSQGGTTHDSCFAFSLAALLASGLTLLGSAAADAQAYPNKPITIITAFGPGSASDTITRVVAQPLGVALKQSVIVEARPGANGAISAMYVARAPADGYTLLMTTNSPHSAAPFLMKNIAYDPIKDFAPGHRGSAASR